MWVRNPPASLETAAMVTVAQGKQSLRGSAWPACVVFDLRSWDPPDFYKQRNLPFNQKQNKSFYWDSCHESPRSASSCGSHVVLKIAICAGKQGLTGLPLRHLSCVCWAQEEACPLWLRIQLSCRIRVSGVTRLRLRQGQCIVKYNFS